MTTEPKNEEPACKAVVCLMEQRRGGPLRVTGQPDRTEREERAVELLFESPSAKYAMEHTRIESFIGQIADGKQFTALLEPLETELAGRVRGHFWLIVPTAATEGLSWADHATIRDHIANWVLEHAERLEAEEETEGEGNFRLTARPPGVPFSVTLQRTRRSGNKLLIFRETPEQLEDLRRQRVRQALDRKCSKLAEQKQQGRESVLVLESDDIALANHAVIGKALQLELPGRTDVPDHIYLVETESRPWTIWVLKEGPAVYPHLEDPGPFDAG